MVMTDMEVIARYSEAKDPAKMVGVLADLNGEPPEMIQEIIRWMVIPTNRLALREIQLRKLYDAGMMQVPKLLRERFTAAILPVKTRQDVRAAAD